jgi:DNA polymerase I-like protein with 3'-5' exonuclease and polymerase domains
VIQWASGDKNLLKEFTEKQKYDLHWRWLYRLLEVYPPYMNHLALASGENKEDQILKAGRTIIKTDFVFASFYGSQSEAVASVSGIPVEIVKKLHEEFWAEYADVLRWQKEVFKFYQDNGFIKTLTNYKRDGVVPGNEPVNNFCQGTAAFVVAEARNSIKEKAFAENDLALLPRWDIHDDLSYLIPDSSDSEQYIKTITEEMVIPRFNFITCPLLVEASVGYNWCDLEEVCKVERGYYKDGKLV